MTQANLATPPCLTITAWSDPTVESAGHRPGSPYVEAVWLGVLGPSTTWAWQRLARIASARPGLRIDTVDLAMSLGLGDGLARNAAISRTLGRLVAFDAASRAGDTLAVRLALPNLPERRLARLSPSARFAHQHLAHQAAAATRASATSPESISL